MPTVILDNATVTGVTSGSTNRFLGIPFAQPPTGNLRFRLPQPLPPYNTNFTSFEYGPACPQQPPFSHPWPSNLPPETIDYLTIVLFNTVTSAEDCLTLNVITPADATPESKLPVLVVSSEVPLPIFALLNYDVWMVTPSWKRSIALGDPIVYVGMNFRTQLFFGLLRADACVAFGFLASQEVKDAGVGNLGLQDQRLALRWVQKYIGAFGGDPTKVTIWGASSGAVSVALHMVTNGGNPQGLFRAAFMQSGAPVLLGDITDGQSYYDALVAETGCSGANDTLQCLREVPYDTLLNAVNMSPGVLSYQSAHLAWIPRVDGVFLTAEPLHLVQQGAFADIPFISGNCDDEGTPFLLGTINITTDAQFEEYIKTYYVPNASRSMIEQVTRYYPSDPTQGSPFDTGYLNVLTPQSKRIAAIEGDVIFQAPRRWLVQNRSGKQAIWTYLNKRLKLVPFLGSFHAHDVPEIYGGSDMASYLVRFVANLDPNNGESTDLYWPQYNAADQTMLELLDGLVPQTLTTDTYRVEQMGYLINVMLSMVNSS
ncbi:alpha beta-hydrolase [Boletus edulis BED1]|uniref:Carboxylic ester hydrolase n=1 Tax=Boletus edulis BED1 TaxID=1328754 RepID=A0AAD4GAB2_BOLED|nr:alpha beta-hydrolase [Boletus edulis BED1]